MFYLDVITPDHLLCDVGNVSKLRVAELMKIVWMVYISEAIVIGTVQNGHGADPLLNAVVGLQDKVFPAGYSLYNPSVPIPNTAGVITQDYEYFSCGLFSCVVNRVNRRAIRPDYYLGVFDIMVKGEVLIFVLLCFVNGNDKLDVFTLT